MGPSLASSPRTFSQVQQPEYTLSMHGYLDWAHRIQRRARVSVYERRVRMAVLDELDMADSSRGLPPLPQEDLALLSGLQPHEVRAVAESKIQAYRVMIENINGYIVQLSTIQNTTVPLHASLPPEVLMNVFRHILPTCRSDLRLTHVCKLWQDLIYRTPEFWVDMLAVCAVTWRPIDHTTVPSYILRSSPLPYKLTITGEYDFLLDMPSLASRMSSLSVHVPRTINSIYHLAQLLHLHMPLLETMRCRAYGENPSWLVDRIQLPPPRGQNFPRLRKLALHGADLPSRALAFPYLEELTYDDGTYSESLLPLLVLLENCPQLRMLDMNIKAPNWQANLEYGPVFLPHSENVFFTSMRKKDHGRIVSWSGYAFRRQHS
ncbi:hypothetical protein K466DRAFT_217663 [Polyporus arcularius HHB13444]|uniref:F-box domain-containing protein n=1 Tax=Polyporus arcularius HHB13444 TaxID=1314778 RepID=A0A5C3PV37_9APHY|nr:hypothetical protein K466DRAFT_217663 [Polyporus arcularius HHB13444]